VTHLVLQILGQPPQLDQDCLLVVVVAGLGDTAVLREGQRVLERTRRKNDEVK